MMDEELQDAYQRTVEAIEAYAGAIEKILSGMPIRVLSINYDGVHLISTVYLN